MNLPDFQHLLLSLTGNFDRFPSYQDLSSDSFESSDLSPLNASLSVFLNISQDPDAELSNDNLTDNSYLGFHNASMGWQNVDATGINLSANKMDFRYISTPETTFGILYSFDARNPDDCPINGLRGIEAIFKDFSDNITVKKNKEATGNSFINDFKNAINNYRYIMVYIECHGGVNFLVTCNKDVNREDLKSLFEQAINKHRRVFCIIDACHSQSMFLNMFGDNKKTLFRAGPGEDPQGDAKNGYEIKQVGNGDKDSLIMCWSSSSKNNVSWYWPKKTTDFATSITDTYKKRKGQRFGGIDGIEGLWKETQKNAISTQKHNDSPNLACPCLETFEPNTFGKFLHLKGYS